MNRLLVVLLFAGIAAAQNGTGGQPLEDSARAPAAAKANQIVLPAGTKVPLVLKQALSTKNARAGDPVYAQTTFPVVLNDRIVIPPGTYVQGKISRVQRAGRIKGRAEVLMHFTSLIFPSGYTVMLPGSVENVPGAEKTAMKGEEGTIRQDSNAGDKAGKAADRGIRGAEGGALGGVLVTRSVGGARAGAGIGAAVGVASAVLTRGNDVRLDAGTTLEMVIQREIALDASRVSSRVASLP